MADKLIDVTLSPRQRTELRDLFAGLGFPPQLQALAAGVIQAANARAVELGRAKEPEAIPFRPQELAFARRVLQAQRDKLDAILAALPPEPAKLEAVPAEGPAAAPPPQETTAEEREAGISA